MAFPPLGNSDHVILVSFDFLSNSKHTLFHHIAYEHLLGDLEGLCDHLRDVPQENIFKISGSAAASGFFQ